MARRRGPRPRCSFRFTVFAAVTVTMALLLVPMATSALAEDTGFGYASCSPDGIHHSEITHVCHQGDLIRAVMRYSARPIDYEICLQFAEGPPSCGDKRHVEPGTSSIAYLPSQNYVGLLAVIWRSNSHEIGRWNIRFVKDPIVPAFGISPLIVSGAHRLFGLLIRHVPPGLRIRAWRQCDGLCPLRLHLTASGSETRRYRIVGSRRNAIFSTGDLLYVEVDAPGKRYRGTKLWGRLYTGKLVRDHSGKRGDTAIRRVGPSLCTPPGKAFRRAVPCRKVPGSSTSFNRVPSEAVPTSVRR